MSSSTGAISAARHGGADRPPEVARPQAAVRRGARRAVVVCDQWLGSDGYAGMKALRRAGWNVEVVPEWEYIPVKWRTLPMKVLGRLARPFATREFNADLLRVAARHRAEMLLVFKGRWVLAETLERLRERGVATYCFYTDVSFRAHGPLIPRALPRYDWVFTTKSFGLEDMRAQLGVTRASVVMLAFDPDLHRPLALTDDERAYFGCDVSYIGTWSPKKEGLLTEIVSRRPSLKVRIWGDQWWKARSSALRPVIAGHDLPGEDYVRAICGSSINLAIMSEARLGSSRGDQIAGRTFSIPAAGGFMIHDRTPDLLALFREGEDVVCYSDADELVAQIDRHLPDEPRRREIAGRAQARVRAEHSYDARIREIIAHHEARAG